MTKENKNIGTKENPWKLKTPPGTSAYEMYKDVKDGKEIIVCTVGKTILHYDAKCINDLHAMLKKEGDWMGKLGNEGKFVGAQPLNKEGKTVSGTKKVISDGPFMEGKEMVGGYLICKANTLEEAVEISKGCPLLENEDGVVEVREIQELKM